MKKEIIIVSIIVIMIIFFNIICQKYINNVIKSMNNKLEYLIFLLDSDNLDNETIKEVAKESSDDWNYYNKILSFYMEHDELEKIDTSVVTYKAYIDSNSYEEAFTEIKKCIFILNHLKQKYDIKITNLF